MIEEDEDFDSAIAHAREEFVRVASRDPASFEVLTQVSQLLVDLAAENAQSEAEGPYIQAHDGLWAREREKPILLTPGIPCECGHAQNCHSAAGCIFVLPGQKLFCPCQRRTR